MGNTYSSIRVDSAANALTDIQAALIARYGAYNDPNNPTGVIIDYNTSPYLIFRCLAIADQYIRLHWTGNAMWAYGDGVSGNDVTNAVRFGGTTSYGAISAAHLVLGPHTLLWNVLQSDHYSRLAIIGQLSNDSYAVCGCTGRNGPSHYPSHYAYNTTTGDRLYPVSFDAPFQNAAGKLYTQKLILRHDAAGVELEANGAIASFQDIWNISFSPGNSNIILGATYLITSSPMAMHDARVVFPTGMYMPFDAA